MPICHSGVEITHSGRVLRSDKKNSGKSQNYFILEVIYQVMRQVVYHYLTFV